MFMMLTEAQEKIFEENKNLVYKAINTYVSNPGKYGIYIILLGTQTKHLIRLYQLLMTMLN